MIKYIKKQLNKSDSEQGLWDIIFFSLLMTLTLGLIAAICLGIELLIAAS